MNYKLSHTWKYYKNKPCLPNYFANFLMRSNDGR